MWWRLLPQPQPNLLCILVIGQTLRTKIAIRSTLYAWTTPTWPLSVYMMVSLITRSSHSQLWYACRSWRQALFGLHLESNTAYDHPEPWSCQWRCHRGDPNHVFCASWHDYNRTASWSLWVHRPLANASDNSTKSNRCQVEKRRHQGNCPQSSKRQYCINRYHRAAFHSPRKCRRLSSRWVDSEQHLI
jgi:hypothetical protein